MWPVQVWHSDFSMTSGSCRPGWEARQGTASAEVLLVCLVPVSSAQFCLEVLALNWKQPSSCALHPIPPGFRIAAVKRQFSVCCSVWETLSSRREKSVCMPVSGCISLSLHFEGYFLSHKHWRLFILYLKLPRNWWYLLNRIYYWFLFILQWGDKAYASLQVWLLVCKSSRMFLSVFPVGKGKSIN